MKTNETQERKGKNLKKKNETKENRASQRIERPSEQNTVMGQPTPVDARGEESAWARHSTSDSSNPWLIGDTTHLQERSGPVACWPNLGPLRTSNGSLLYILVRWSSINLAREKKTCFAYLTSWPVPQLAQRLITTRKCIQKEIWTIWRIFLLHLSAKYYANNYAHVMSFHTYPFLG